MSVSSDDENDEMLPHSNDEMNILAHVSDMQYNNFSVKVSGDAGSPDPDTFPQGNLLLPNSVGYYYFPNYPSSNTLSVISLRINRITLDSFVDEYISPLEQQKTLLLSV